MNLFHIRHLIQFKHLFLMLCHVEKCCLGTIVHYLFLLPKRTTNRLPKIAWKMSNIVCPMLKIANKKYFSPLHQQDWLELKQIFLLPPFSVHPFPKCFYNVLAKAILKIWSMAVIKKSFLPSNRNTVVHWWPYGMSLFSALIWRRTLRRSFTNCGFFLATLHCFKEE